MANLSPDWLTAVNDVFSTKRLPALSEAEQAALEQAVAKCRAGDAADLVGFWRGLYGARTRANPLQMRDPWDGIGGAIDAFRLVLDTDGALTAVFADLDAQLAQDRLVQQASQVQYLQQLNFHLEYELEQRNTRLGYFQDLHDQARAELYALHEISMYVNSSLKQDDVLRCTIDGLVGMLDLSHCGLFLLDTDDQLAYAAGHGLTLPEGYRAPGDGWLARTALETHFTKLDGLRARGEAVSDLLGLAEDLESVVLFPLIKAETTMGVLLLGDDGSGRGVPLSTVDFVNVLVPHVASALHNAELYQKLNQMAITDGLTGLFNHRYFHERLQHNIEVSRRYMRPFSLLMIDIDHFKQFNDTYGHQAGDRVLRFVAKQLKQMLRGTDILARYGGEEFAIQLLETPHDRVRLVAERLVQAFREETIELPTAAEPVSITISVGVATFPYDGESTTELIHFADQGLYAAKRAGRNRVG